MTLERARRIEEACMRLMGTGMDLAVSERFDSSPPPGPPGTRYVLEMWPVWPGEKPQPGTTQVYLVSRMPCGHA